MIKQGNLFEYFIWWSLSSTFFLKLAPWGCFPDFFLTNLDIGAIVLIKRDHLVKMILSCHHVLFLFDIGTSAMKLNRNGFNYTTLRHSRLIFQAMYLLDLLNLPLIIPFLLQLLFHQKALSKWMQQNLISNYHVIVIYAFFKPEEDQYNELMITGEILEYKNADYMLALN